MRADRRRGFTVAEFLIIVALTAVLIGLFVTAIQRMRESANRLHCADNLRRMGEAVRHFHEQQFPKALPPSRLGERHATWAVLIAPYLSRRDNPLQGWDLRLPYYAQPAAVRESQVRGFFCPTRRSPPQNSVSGDVPTDGVPDQEHYPGVLSDYACSAGDGSPERPWDTDSSGAALLPAQVLERKDNQILSWRSRTDFDSLKRGVAQTILIGEKHVPEGVFGRAEQGDGSVYNGEYPANFSRVGGPGFGLAPSPAAEFNRNFGSYHTGGVCQFLMADGSVRPFTPAVDEELLGRLMLRDEE
jgi:prepilin-type processing-associated H-X9-DG protein